MGYAHAMAVTLASLFPEMNASYLAGLPDENHDEVKTTKARKGKQS